MRAAGFSLLELLIVVGLMISMYVILLSPSSKSYQSKEKAACAKNLEGIFVALKTWSIDHGANLPDATNALTSEAPLSELIPRETTVTSFFICPGSGDSVLPDARPFANRRISYAYYMGGTLADSAVEPLISDRQVNTKSKLEHDPLFSADGRKPGNNHNRYGGNVMFRDGSIRRSGPLAEFSLTNGPGVTLLNPKP